MSAAIGQQPSDGFGARAGLRSLEMGLGPRAAFCPGQALALEVALLQWVGKITTRMAGLKFLGKIDLTTYHFYLVKVFLL
ncbi:hypothetical protein Pyn_12073 [Prunus yedoensis var. nudiflora]|uniref:Uncharacterized protein n=1 Tax=Prunus yedoensis var. nudiflora TaxID=2094558 RepID=A0A314Z7C3_PRUYE|nr:hypothetical protein Pyn_12073 [Prunus yedoensis var. nudiflora]